MAEKPQFHNRFRLDGYASRASPSAKVTKRHRVPLSCTPCRVRKSEYLCRTYPCSFADCTRLRCNRAQPCEHCIKRGDAASCSYATPTDLPVSVGVDSGNKTQQTGEQLYCLEHLVAEAIKLHQSTTQSPVCDTISFIARH